MTKEKIKKTKIALVGGDLRQLTCASELEKLGYTVSLYGFDTYRECPDIGQCLENADVLLLPVPVMRGDVLNMTLRNERLSIKELLSLIDGTGIRLVCGGKLPKELSLALFSKRIDVFDLCENETFNYLNAVPTAEGAIALCMNHTPVTVCGSSLAVIGYGRIGRCLCRRLSSLGARVTVAARKEKDRAEAKCEGFTSCDYSSLPSLANTFECVFNTVPEVVLTEPFLSKLKKGAPLIELASKPGGVDTAEAIRHEVRVISAQSLPGRVAPVSAGRIIAACIDSRLESEAES